MDNGMAIRLSWFFLIAAVVALVLCYFSESQIENESQRFLNVKAIASKSPRGMEKRVVFFSENGIVATTSCFGFESTLCSHESFMSPIVVDYVDIFSGQRGQSVIKKISIFNNGKSYEKINLAADDYFEATYIDRLARRKFLFIASCVLFSLFVSIRFFAK